MTGASPDGDRAVVNGAGQAVSALRASVPSAGSRRKDLLEVVRDAGREIGQLRDLRDEMFEALLAAEELYQTGLLASPAEEIERVHQMRRDAIASYFQAFP